MNLRAGTSLKKLWKIAKGQSLRTSPGLKLISGLALVFLGTIMFPRPESVEPSYGTGGIWTDKDLTAPFSFPVYKDIRQYQKERREAARSVYPVFQPNETVSKSVIDSIHAIYRILPRIALSGLRTSQGQARDDSLSFTREAAKLPFTLRPDEWNAVRRWADDTKRGGRNPLASMEQVTSGLIAEQLRTGVIDQLKSQLTNTTIAIRLGTTEELVPVSRLRDPEQAMNEVSARLAQALNEGAEETIGMTIARSLFRPNIIFNQESTSKALHIAEENVPRTVGFVLENERIIGKGERITDDIRLKLESLRRTKSELTADAAGWKHWIGSFMHVSLIVGLLGMYLFMFRKRIFGDNGKLSLIGLLILLMMFVAWCSMELDVRYPVQYLIVVPVASMLLAILFDSRVAFFGTVASALLVAGIRGNDYHVALASLVAGTMAVTTVRDLQSRTQIFRSLGVIFGGYSLAIIALSLEQLQSFSTIGTELVFALANAIISPLLTYGLLIFLERVFRVTTDLTLIELSDFNHPLLQELSEKAPGTFHHSVTIGNLAEAAAEAIGANAILARVGGYYHDIGKSDKPEYFVENQVGPHSRHNRLKPRMSALIISSHVREGIELGRKWGIPEVVLDFIPQHHGTTRISFFYDKALKQAAKKQSSEVISEEDFRYPGPKPQTKEAGLVMLADSVEASTRSLTEMTPQRLEQSIENMIKHRFIEGQLDECELTLKDLTNTKEAFLRILTGIHHQRLVYPEQEISVREAPPPVEAPPVPVEEITPAGSAAGPEPAEPANTPPADPEIQPV